ncbi:MAG: RHS repeat-associated core domain-containing protein, partial [Bacteroidia bacterium]
VLSITDYYAFGGELPGRKWVNEEFKFGYQGQEKNSESNPWYQFELRMYNQDIGRWFAPDPYGQFASPYIAMANNPVSGIDPDGGVVSNFRWTMNTISGNSGGYATGGAPFVGADDDGSDVITLFTGGLGADLHAQKQSGSSGSSGGRGGNELFDIDDNGHVITKSADSDFMETSEAGYDSWWVSAQPPTESAKFDSEVGMWYWEVSYYVQETQSLLDNSYENSINFYDVTERHYQSHTDYSVAKGNGTTFDFSVPANNFVDDFGQLLNVGSVFWGGAELGVQALRQTNAAKIMGDAMGYGTQKMAQTLRGTLKSISNIGIKLGVAGYVLQVGSLVYKSANGTPITTADKVAFGISTGLVTAAYLTAGTLAAPFVAGAGVIYGLAELISWGLTDQTLEENLFNEQPKTKP